MDLGAFSISLNVKDIKVSRDFYQKLGFEPFAGSVDENWLILRNRDHVIGLFQGMLKSNVMTFNPGWDQSGQETEAYTDVREIQKALREAGIEPSTKTPEDGSGPAFFQLTDPDGNEILLDQHR